MNPVNPPKAQGRDEPEVLAEPSRGLPTMPPEFWELQGLLEDLRDMWAKVDKPTPLEKGMRMALGSAMDRVNVRIEVCKKRQSNRISGEGELLGKLRFWWYDSDNPTSAGHLAYSFVPVDPHALIRDRKDGDEVTLYTAPVEKGIAALSQRDEGLREVKSAAPSAEEP